jgi:hypothetical protein
MSLDRFHRMVSIAAILLLFLGTDALASSLDEPQYLGKTVDYWIKVIRDRDEQKISLAFDAIRALGPDAQAAVPDLIAIVVAPFTPILIGTDSQTVIASKIYDIEIRAGAIDSLTAIGESAGSATVPLIRWALTRRVIPENIRNEEDRELFTELVIMDTEQRMGIAGAVDEFGKAASTAIAALLSSQNDDKRKFGVAILGPDALPIAEELLRSPHCDDRNLGLQILRDMDLVVPKSHLDTLELQVLCNAN